LRIYIWPGGSIDRPGELKIPCSNVADVSRAVRDISQLIQSNVLASGELDNSKAHIIVEIQFRDGVF